MPLHPRLVHFPVALLLVGSLLLLVSLRWPRNALRQSGWLNLLLGWVALFPAILTGLADQGALPDTPTVEQVLNRHITGGIALLAIYGYVLYERLRAPHVLDTKARYRVGALLLVGLVVLLITGDLGGQLAYELLPRN